ncbi:hypothetical protein ACF064_21250 [Streptomyces sp. NPDC015492]|uniref:hypothetical protein n=1 Tax=unclassified Streptomyces TaxID=2593676 RepID=UPI0036F960A6
MSSVRLSAVLRAALLLVLALACGGPPPAPAGPAASLQRPCAQQVAPTAAAESSHTGGGEADAPGGSALHRDRRRPVTLTVALPGHPPATRATPLADLTADRPGGADPRPRPLASRDSATLQVFRC